MNATLIDVCDIPKASHREAMQIAETEYGRMGDLLQSLEPDDWDRPTDCDLWTVKDIVNHIVGINEGVLSPREMMRQQRAGKTFRAELGLSKFDAGNQVPVRERRNLTPEQVRASYKEIVPRILRRRTRLPRPFHAILMPDGVGGWFRFGHLLDTVLTRDIWMHRVDITRATGRDMVLTPGHDGRIVSVVVADLAKKRNESFALWLQGPAGATYVRGSEGEEQSLDAVEFCRILSGRSEGAGVLKTSVVF